MKEKVNLVMLISKSNNKELTMIYNLVKKHSYFAGNRRKIYKLIVKYKNNKGVK